MKELKLNQKVKVTLRVEMSPDRVQEVSQALVDLLNELDVFNGTLEQGQIEVDLES